MSKSSLIDNAEITEVYYKVGKFSNDNRDKFVKAPFDMVRMNGAFGVQPLAVGGTATDLNTMISADPTTDEYNLGRRDFGYVNLTPYVTGEQEWGDFTRDDIRGVHKFSII
ncbi:MAG: hypothetical protein PHE50_00230 [Dehalococcoidales bacterium]|nr:hypothetical protein [Dehalococcoidales bacterium]